MAKLGRYEEALVYFKKCQPLRPAPRFTDCEDAISQICMILGDIDGAIEAQKQMLEIMKEDWTTEGESVDSILREIKRLEGLKN
jgi:tetratricopeptide (TPR) repeat protein